MTSGSHTNDPLTLLPLGRLESRALPGETYTLAFTPEHLNLLFGDRVTEAMLSGEGRYVHFEGDGNWWIPSGRVFLSENEHDSAAEEFLASRQHFFVPVRFRDAFHQTTTVGYDAHVLLVVRTTDPLGNSGFAQFNYRLLAPELIPDANRNRSAVAFDVLGRVAGTAVMGKVLENIGDALDGFQAQLTQAQIDSFLAAPRGPIATELLGRATSRVLYDDARYVRVGESRCSQPRSPE
jgi:YD repeat-containing protein